jgi:hypothetical protein
MWAVAACVVAVWLGLALKVGEARDWIRRGAHERRARRRPDDRDDVT